ncbi:DHA2 family efflux MFS transporter permease subunit [Arsenicicoccus sp. oral taxon 190]|uniref:DHA2 family efflux MFS transporter permease subunit n=1 Tax=Arsenicicoccus sp. oral taxon 190 TaxID=1658671 RepID=UPI00067A21AC|nr:DHA2 family efflux MFS transporter permease subunit [Arsenicicoccus sp. oral taxon 190]AKT52681.1 multidrug MFS transporter [Arsenicicoccus sp. oral taxon 190]
MILVDSTIVTVAMPALMSGLHADIGQAVWVTSAYLLAYAVPLLITGRLGDRFGPKRVYLVGLTIFTLASLWCGLTTTITALIVARVVQGLGAALMSPQTMSVITRLFPPQTRGQAMGLWGAVAGVATLVGPILGGVLVDSLGWEWIFFVNVPVGVLALVLAVRLVPHLDTHPHRFDWFGVALSAVGLFCIVFAIEEGHSYDWGTISGPVTVWRLLILGVLVMAGFVVWQWRQRGEPLVPLRLFRDRNFSVANVAITTVGFAVTATMFPIMIWAQSVRGLSPTGAALLMAPMAVISGGLAPVVGRLVGRAHPRLLAGFGLGCYAVSLVWLRGVLHADTALWEILLPAALLGVANGFMWAPISTSATANLERHQAGAGSGVYNTTRQIGSVLGSAAIALAMQDRLAAHLPGHAGGAAPTAGPGGGHMPAAVAQAFSDAMGDSLLVPAVVIAVGALVALGFERPRHQRG